MKVDNSLVNYLNKINSSSMAESTKVPGMEAVDFGEALNNALAKINGSDSESTTMGQLLSIDQLQNPHDLTISATKAELTLNYAIEVKNRVIESYREIMRMQF